jgi:hypothetical protein
MASRRDRGLAGAAALATLLSVGAAAFAYREQILERFYLWRLQYGSVAERELAAERLGLLRSARAVPLLLERFNDYLVLDGVIQYPIPEDPHVTALARIGAPAVPSLVDAVRNGEFPTRIYATCVLEKLAADASPAVPVLSQAVTGDDLNLSLFAAKALRSIGPGARSAIPALIEAARDGGEWISLFRFEALRQEALQAAAEALRRIETGGDQGMESLKRSRCKRPGQVEASPDPSPFHGFSLLSSFRAAFSWKSSSSASSGVGDPRRLRLQGAPGLSAGPKPGQGTSAPWTAGGNGHFTDTAPAALAAQRVTAARWIVYPALH